MGNADSSSSSSDYSDSKRMRGEEGEGDGDGYYIVRFPYSDYINDEIRIDIAHLRPSGVDLNAYMDKYIRDALIPQYEIMKPKILKLRFMGEVNNDMLRIVLTRIDAVYHIDQVNFELHPKNKVTNDALNVVLDVLKDTPKETYVNFEYESGRNNVYNFPNKESLEILAERLNEDSMLRVIVDVEKIEVLETSTQTLFEIYKKYNGFKDFIFSVYDIRLDFFDAIRSLIRGHTRNYSIYMGEISKDVIDAVFDMHKDEFNGSKKVITSLRIRKTQDDMGLVVYILERLSPYIESINSFHLTVKSIRIDLIQSMAEFINDKKVKDLDIYFEDLPQVEEIDGLAEALIGNTTLESMALGFESSFRRVKNEPERVKRQTKFKEAFEELTRRTCIKKMYINELIGDNQTELDDLLRIPVEMRELPIKSSTKSAAKIG